MALLGERTVANGFRLADGCAGRAHLSSRCGMTCVGSERRGADLAPTQPARTRRRARALGCPLQPRPSIDTALPEFW